MIDRSITFFFVARTSADERWLVILSVVNGRLRRMRGLVRDLDVSYQYYIERKEGLTGG